MRIDDDQDAVWLMVDVVGAASCHVGYRSCFYRAVPTGKAADEALELDYKEDEKVFDPVEVYGDAPNPTIL
jgi:phosphoribosyl-AMP cyclohydrolase